MAPTATMTMTAADPTHKTEKQSTNRGASAGFFTCLEQPEERELKVEGAIPSWVQGVLYRTGPGRYEVGKQNISHWFDGKGLNHRFVVSGKDNTVTYRSRESCAMQIGQEAKAGKMSAVTFAQPSDPCQGLFAKFFTSFQNLTPRSTKSLSPGGANVSVVLEDINGVLTAKTDANVLQSLDPVTLEPLEVFSYGSLDKALQGQMTAAHGASIGAQFYNFVLTPGPVPIYKVFVHDRATNQARVLCTILDAPPAYLHSLAATEKHVILTIWQADFPNQALGIVWNGNIVQGMGKWNPNRKTLHYVIDRHSGQLKAKITSPALFCFHHINAYDDDDEGGSSPSVVLDMATYQDTSVLEALRIASLRRYNPKENVISQYRRIRLPLPTDKKARRASHNEAITEVEPRRDINIELPTVNPKCQWKRARYAYGIHRSQNAQEPGTFVDAIIKVDMHNPTLSSATLWREEGQVPGEPIFVPHPDTDDEDAGALLTVSLDVRSQASQLVVLDAETMQPLARAKLETVFPFGFHGTFLK